MTHAVPADDGHAARLRLLGVPRLELPAAAPVVLERRTAALLALLTFNGPTPRARAAALVWPESDERHASNSLRQRIFKLRQAAGRDVIAADKLVALAADIGHDLQAVPARLTDDPESSQGELLGDLDFADCGTLDEWVGVARQRWRTELARALAEAASTLEGQGRIAAALRLGERLIELDPVAEHAHRRVMRLHYLRGDRAAALAAFDRCRVVLRSELGVLPDRETQDLQQLIENAAVPQARMTPAPSAAVLRPPRLVGRDAEWERLTQAHAQGRAALLVGEAGIGKSRLLSDAVQALGGVAVAARPGDAVVPYASLARVLRAVFDRVGPALRPPGDAVLTESLAEVARLLPELGAAAAGPFEPLRLRGAVAHCLESAAAAGLAVIGADDLHFADAATLDWLPTLARRHGPAGRGIRWLLATRAAEMPPTFRTWADAQDTDGLAVVTLAPLDEAAVRALLESMAVPGLDSARWAPALARHAGGNPLFILETLRSLLERRSGLPDPDGGALPLPADVGHLIERRLQQLSAEALDLARVAALAGQDFSPELAAQVLQRRVIDLAAPWGELEAAQVIRDQAFAHDLILDATQHSVPAAVARALHRAIAGVLQAASAAPGRVAEHFQRGGEHDAAATAFLAAADAARSKSRLDDELALLGRAHACLLEIGHDGREPQVLYRMGVSAFELGRIDEVRRLSDALERVATQPADRVLAVEARLRVLGQDHAFIELLDAMPQAEALAAAHGSGYQQVFLGVLKSDCLARTGRPDEALQALQTGFDWIHREPEHPWVPGFLVQTSYIASYLERYDLCLERGRLAYQAAERNHDIRHMHMASVAVAMMEWLRGNVEAAAREYERCRSLAARYRGNSEGNSNHGEALAFCLRQIGRFAEALDMAQAHADQIRASQAGEWWQVQADVELVRCHFELGQHARALGVLGDRPPANDDARLRWLMVRIRVAPASATQRRQWLDEAVALCEGGMRPNGKRWTLAPDLIAAAPLEEARELEGRYTQACRTAGAHMYVRPMRLRLIEALLREQQVQEAHERARAFVAEAAGATPYGMYLPETWWILHRAFAVAGDAAPAQATLEAAVQWIEQTALPNVPEPFRESFLHRNAINRTVLTAARRLPAQ